MNVPKEYRSLLYVSYLLLYVFCLFNVSFAKKCLHHEGPVMEMCTDSVIQAQHAVILETSLFSGKGNCVCNFNVTGDYLEIGHLDFPEQCSNKLDFRMGAEGSPVSDVQTIECKKVTAEFNTTEVKEGNVVLSQTEFGAAETGSSCVSMETDPNEYVYVHCKAVVEESTRTLTSDTTTDNKLTPISIKDMFQDQSTGASKAIQELLSKSGLSQDSIFLEPNLIQTQSIKSLNLMDKMVTPEMIREDTKASTPSEVSSNATPMSTEPTTVETTVSPATVSQETSTFETSEQTTSITQETTTQTTEGSTSSALSTTVPPKTSSTSSQTSPIPTTSHPKDKHLLIADSTSTVASILSSSTKLTESHTDEHSPPPSTSSPSTTTKKISSSTPTSTPLAVKGTTAPKVEIPTTVEENVTTIVPSSSTTVSGEIKTTTSTQDSLLTTAALDVASVDKGSETTTQESTSKSEPLDVSPTAPTVKSSDITTTILSTTVLGLSSNQEKSTSSRPNSDLTTSVLSSTPKSLPVTTSPVDNLPLKMPAESKIAPTEPVEMTTTKIYPTRALKDIVSTPSMLEPSTPEILSTSHYTFYTALPDLNELYSEELLRIGSSSVLPVHIVDAKKTTKSEMARTTSSPGALNEKATTDARTTPPEAATTMKTTTKDSAVTTTVATEASKTTESAKPTTSKSVTEVNSDTTKDAVTEQPSTTDNESLKTLITSMKETTTQAVSSTTEKPTTTTARITKLTSTTFKPTTEKVVPTIAIKTTQAPVVHVHDVPATPEPTFVPSIKPRGDMEQKTAQPIIVDKPVMTRLPPIVIPVDGTKQITFKPSFTPEHKDSDHSHDKPHGESKPPADLSTVDDSEQLDDDTITVIVVGSVIGILVFIAIIVILTTFLKSRRNASKQTEEKDDIEMNGGTKGIDNPLLQLEEESMAANGTAGHANGKANGVVEGKPEESPTETAKSSGAEEISPKEKTTTENKSEDL